MKTLLSLFLVCLVIKSVAQNPVVAPAQLYSLANQALQVSRAELQKQLGAPQHRQPLADGESWTYQQKGLQLRYLFNSNGEVIAFTGERQPTLVKQLNFPFSLLGSEGSHAAWYEELGAPHRVQLQNGQSQWYYTFTDHRNNQVRIQLQFNSEGELLPQGFNALWQFTETKKLNRKKIGTLQPGKSTEAQVVRRLGQPSERIFTEAQSKWRYRSENVFLDLEFDEAGVLKEVWYRERM